MQMRGDSKRPLWFWDWRVAGHWAWAWIACVVLGLGSSLQAGDSPREYLSANGKYYVRLPRVKEVDPPAEALEATFGELRWGFIHLKKSTILLPGAPHEKVLVSNQGDFCIAISSVYQNIARPDSTVATILKTDGALHRAVKLSDLFTEGDLECLLNRLNTIVTDGTPSLEHYLESKLDDVRGELVFNAGTEGPEAHSVDICVDIRSGALTEPMRDRLWRQRWVYTVGTCPAPAGAVDLASFAVEAPMPKYPTLAKLAKVAGTVVVEIDLDAEGRVMKAQASEGSPKLRFTAENAVKSWRFRVDRMSADAPRSGCVAIRFDQELVTRR